MIEQGFNYADSIIKLNFIETRVQNLEPKEEKKLICSRQEIQGQEIHEEMEMSRLRLQRRRVQQRIFCGA